MPKNEIDYIDALKGFGILAVILGHMNSPLGTFIYSWHMPLFFFISGLFFHANFKFEIFFKKQIQRLIIPYLLFGIIGISIELIKRSLLDRAFPNIPEEILGLFYYCDIKYMHHYGFVLWFLPALFFSKILAFALFKKINKVLSLLIALLLATILIYSGYKIPFGIDKGILGSVWLIFGNIFFASFEKITINKIFIVIALLFFALLMPTPKLDLANLYFESFIYNLYYSLVIILLLFYFCSAIKFSKKYYLLQWFGRESMLVFLIHPYTNNIAYIFLKNDSELFWPLRFLLSCFLLKIILILKDRLPKYKVLNYV